MPVCSVFRRLQSRRGGGGVERGGDACIAPGGSTLSGLGDASIPTPTRLAMTIQNNLPLKALLHTTPALTI